MRLKPRAAPSTGSTFRIGINGNLHMMMQDKNNAAIAEVIQNCLISKGMVN